MASDYERIAKAIEYIRTNVENQPSLSDIAAQIHLSEYHFQRLFSRWAGVTPKRYLQLLTLEKAKSILTESPLIADAVFESGLSSGSRLYDHFVQIEGVTPSEFKTQGNGLIISYGYHPSPFGEIFIAKTDRGICQLDFIDPDLRNEPLTRLQATWKAATFCEDKKSTADIATQLFTEPKNDDKPLSLWVKGTNFQLNVWRALLNLPLGEVSSYSEIAQQVGKPKASRAVGTAIGSNPIALIIPCHRVLRQNGELGGYRWGTTRKHAILAREFAQTTND